MTKHTPSTSPFKVMEEEAYHVFLEWPVWLALREKELAAYLAETRPSVDQYAAENVRNGDQRQNKT
jgi:hypothetical protein